MTADLNEISGLLTALRRLTRPNVLELSRRLGLARNTVQARLDRLTERGVITGYQPVVDLGALGFDVLAYMTVEISQGADAAAVAALGAIPEVLEVHKVTGPGDLLLRVVARTNDHLHRVVERVLAVTGVGRTTTTLVLHSPVNDLTIDAGAVAELLDD